MSDTAPPAQTSFDVSPAKMRQVIVASTAGTVFEWYDFFVYITVAEFIRQNFYAGLPDFQANLFLLLTFAVGFIFRPVGALIFGKMGDSIGRKGTFLVTITMMGLATFAIGLLPSVQQIGVWAPILLVTARILQGIALGGEYGGAATYVAEHAARNRRGSATAWIQTSASIGLVGALLVVLLTRVSVGDEQFSASAWRWPFLFSVLLLLISLWIRLQLEESPAFKKIQEEGGVSKRAYAESFLEWRNLKIVLIALGGVMIAQGVVWYTAHIYTQFYLSTILKIDTKTVSVLMITVVAISAPLYLFFARISDTIGRKPVMLFGMVLMLVLYFPGFQFITASGNPPLAAASRTSPVTVITDPTDCSFQLDLTGGAAQFARSCDIAKSALSSSGVSYTTEAAPPGTLAHVRIGGADVQSVGAVGQTNAQIRAARKDFGERLQAALVSAGYPKAAPGAMTEWSVSEVLRVLREKAGVLAVMIGFIIAATALYGPQAAALVELFPTRIRYTALSLPYHIGTGWFGGLLPATVFAINTATGNIYAGLWFPVIATMFAIVITFFFWPETKDRDIHAI